MKPSILSNPLPMKHWLSIRLAALILSLTSAIAVADDAANQGGEIVIAENQVDRSPPKAAWMRATPGDKVRWEEQVRTGELSRAAIELSTGGVLRLSELTSLRLKPPTAEQTNSRSKIDFGTGVAYFFSRAEEEADIKTPTASLNIRGTEFVLEVGSDGKTTVTLLDGAVGLSNELGAVDLASGEQGIVERGRPPRKTAVLDASERIQWFLYYPGIADPARFAGLAKGRFGKSLTAYKSGNLLAALELLPTPSTPQEFGFSAVVKLASGRIDEVKADLARCGDPALAKSLQLLIDVVRKPEAKDDLQQAPTTAEGRMALSYALQARGDLDSALKAARDVAESSPEFGFAWARIAELEFSFGRNEAAIEAVTRALEFSPKNAQARSLKGYLELSKSRSIQAHEEFSQAIAIDPALGNAWLGQGLAFFQTRDRKAGLRAITIAASVEPNRSFIRSYLGKALAENQRDDRASNELEIARRLDPGDPTAPFYQALFGQRRSAYNRSVANLEESISLNDNRALYRSAFLLDKDRAVRRSNLASIYENVGMTEVSLEEAHQAVMDDYVNSSAHLFLSNSFNNLRDPRRLSLRNETPWFNELLIANLLSPAGTALLAQNISQQEYTDLFATNRFSFSSRTAYRSDGEFIATGTLQQNFERTSVAFDYDVFTSDGQDPNEDIERYTGYLQIKQALSPRDSLYLNLKFEDIDRGDNSRLYDRSKRDPDLRIRQEQSPITIIGYQHEWSPESRTLMLGGLLTERGEVNNPGASSILMLIDPADPKLTAPIQFTSDLHQVRETEIYFGEIQQIWSDERQTLLVGSRFDTGSFPTTNTFKNQTTSNLLPGDPDPVRTDPDYNRWVAYAYYTRELIKGLHATAGLAYDWQETPSNTSAPPVGDGLDEFSGLLPKAGLSWNPSDDLTLRLGYARSVGGPTFDESVRLEPTQVAGFTQSYRTLVDSTENGTLASPEFDTVGAAISYQLPTRTYLGAEGFFRRAKSQQDLGVLTVDSNFDYTDSLQLAQNIEYQELGGTVYVNQLIGEQWALGARYTYTDGELDRSYPGLTAAGINGFSAAESSDLHQAETYLIWNHESGWFSRLNARFFSQENAGYTPNRPGDSWTQLDFSVGKRFFDNRGSLECGVLNLTGDDYQFNPLITLPDFPRERLFFIEIRVDL
jgi:tetratricopeptide (TPR) repeat protein